MNKSPADVTDEIDKIIQSDNDNNNKDPRILDNYTTSL